MQKKTHLETALLYLPQHPTPQIFPNPDIPYETVNISFSDNQFIIIERNTCLPQNLYVEITRFNDKTRSWFITAASVEDSFLHQKESSYLCKLSIKDVVPQESDFEFILNQSTFKKLPQQILIEILNVLKKRSLVSKEPVDWEEGERSISFVKEGCINEFLINQDGTKKPIRVIEPQGIVGVNTSLLDNNTHISFEAKTQALLWQMPSETLLQLAIRHSELRSFYSEVLAKYFKNWPPTIERRIGKFLMRDFIGKGAWGIVYRGQHKTLNMPVALKMLKHEMTLEEEFVTNFKAEAQIIAKLSHPNIINIYDIEEAYKTIFIAMELLDGQALEDILRINPVTSYSNTINIIRQILSGLTYAHERQIIHRDIKPENIFITENNHVKILDFGLACAMGTVDYNMAGTLQYSPPEQIDGDPVDGRADLYALGIMTYEMVIGTRPYPEDDLLALHDLHCEEDIPDPAIKSPNMPKNLREFIMKCCARKVDDRYPNARAALAALDPSSPTQSKKPQDTESMSKIIVLQYEKKLQSQLDSLIEDFGNQVDKLGAKLQVVNIEPPNK